jgi:hypothetical protein
MLRFTHYIKQHPLRTAIAFTLLVAVGMLGLRLAAAWHVVNETFNVTLAKDAKSDEYLGEIVSENRDPRTGKVVSYSIRRKDGGLTERSADSVKAFMP